MATLLSDHSHSLTHLMQITIQTGITGKVNNKLSGHCSTAPPHLTHYSSFLQTHAKQKENAPRHVPLLRTEVCLAAKLSTETHNHASDHMGNI